MELMSPVLKKRGTFTDIAFPGMYNWIIAQGITARGRAVGNVFLPPDYFYVGSPGGSYGFVREPRRGRVRIGGASGTRSTKDWRSRWEATKG